MSEATRPPALIQMKTAGTGVVKTETDFPSKCANTENQSKVIPKLIQSRKKSQVSGLKPSSDAATCNVYAVAKKNVKCPNSSDCSSIM